MKPISTKNLEDLAGVDSLKQLLQSLAVLDLIMCPERDYRYYSFDSRWGEGETMGSMRNGCGDTFTALFDSNGCFFKGFSHDSRLSSWFKGNLERWRKRLENVPTQFCEPAFDMDSISFCFWRTYKDDAWQQAVLKTLGAGDLDGSEFLLGCFDYDPMRYQNFAKEYYEAQIQCLPIQHIYSHAPITQEIIDLLNPEVKLAEIEEELLKIGYCAAKNVRIFKH